MLWTMTDREALAAADRALALSAMVRCAFLRIAGGKRVLDAILPGYAIVPGFR